MQTQYKVVQAETACEYHVLCCGQTEQIGIETDRQTDTGNIILRRKLICAVFFRFRLEVSLSLSLSLSLPVQVLFSILIDTRLTP